MHSLYTLRKIVRIVMLRVQFAIEFSKDAMHAIRQVLWAAEDPIELRRLNRTGIENRFFIILMSTFPRASNVHIVLLTESSALTASSELTVSLVLKTISPLNI